VKFGLRVRKEERDPRKLYTEIFQEGRLRRCREVLFLRAEVNAVSRPAQIRLYGTGFRLRKPVRGPYPKPGTTFDHHYADVENHYRR
jgi:hypothetical protein